jgi:hypothetical protein
MCFYDSLGVLQYVQRGIILGSVFLVLLNATELFI